MVKKAKIVKREVFDARITRIKSALGIKSDSELAKSLDITQQAIAGVKKRKQIPSSWLEKLAQRRISIDFVFFGKESDNSTGSRNPNGSGIDLLIEKIGERGKEISLVELKTKKEDAQQAETSAVNQLLEYVSLLRGKKPNSYNYSILELILRKQIMGKVMAEIIDIMDELEKIAENHKDNHF
jgi:predicted ATPase